MRKKALVIGGSLSGLLVARVLSDVFDEVTVLERDEFPAEAENRRGVPQGWHAHGLLASGSDTIEKLFPGISIELVEAGALRADVMNDGRWFFEGDFLKRVPSDTIGLLLSRPLLENAVRLRARALDRVSIVDKSTVRDLLVEGDAVRGVVTESRPHYADLVIDASGRGSQALKWLEAMKFPVPPEEKVEVQLAYTTRYFRGHPADSNHCLFGVINPSASNPTSGVVLAQENDRWVVTLIGRFGVKPPEDIYGFLEFARNLNSPLIYDIIRYAEPLGKPFSMRFPASVRRRYEKLRRVPQGFLTFGDAICSFNPAYGQGISVAALQALVLRNELSHGLAGLPERFYRSASKVIDIPWGIAVGSDLKMPHVKGKRTLSGRMLGWYIARLHRLAHHDAEASAAFLRVAQLLDRPSTLLRPGLVMRTLTDAYARTQPSASFAARRESH